MRRPDTLFRFSKTFLVIIYAHEVLVYIKFLKHIARTRSLMSSQDHRSTRDFPKDSRPLLSDYTAAIAANAEHEEVSSSTEGHGHW